MVRIAPLTIAAIGLSSMAAADPTYNNGTGVNYQQHNGGTGVAPPPPGVTQTQEHQLDGRAQKRKSGKNSNAATTAKPNTSKSHGCGEIDTTTVTPSLTTYTSGSQTITSTVTPTESSDWTIPERCVATETAEGKAAGMDNYIGSFIKAAKPKKKKKKKRA